MDTRRVAGTRESFGPAAEVGTDTGSVQLIELAYARYVVASRRHRDLGAMLSMLAVIGILSVIAILAIATSAGWSILDAY